MYLEFKQKNQGIRQVSHLADGRLKSRKPCFLSSIKMFTKRLFNYFEISPPKRLKEKNKTKQKNPYQCHKCQCNPMSQFSSINFQMLYELPFLMRD